VCPYSCRTNRTPRLAPPHASALVRVSPSWLPRSALRPAAPSGPMTWPTSRCSAQPSGTRCLSCNCCICNTRPRDPLESHAAALRPDPGGPDLCLAALADTIRTGRSRRQHVSGCQRGRRVLGTSRFPASMPFQALVNRGLMSPASRRGSLGHTPERSSNGQTF